MVTNYPINTVPNNVKIQLRSSTLEFRILLGSPGDGKKKQISFSLSSPASEIHYKKIEKLINCGFVYLGYMQSVGKPYLV